MLTAEVPFGGALACVMAQHQHAALPLERLASFPQPAGGLIERSLDKDPSPRFQMPTELLKALATVSEAIEKAARLAIQASDRWPRSLAILQPAKHQREGDPRRFQ